MNLHELPQISGQAGNGQGVLYGDPDRGEPLFPVPAVLSDDMLDIALVNQVVALQDVLYGAPVFTAVNDFLLVFEGNLGIRDPSGKEQGMCMEALLAEDPLDQERNEL